MSLPSKGWICPQGENPLYDLVQLLLKEPQLHDITVIVPTARFGNALLDLLTQSHCAFRPPQIMTVDQWLWNSTEKKISPVEPQVEELLLTAMLRHESYQYLQPQHAHELRQLFHDLNLHADITSFEKALEVFCDDPFHDPRYLSILTTRLQEVMDLKHKFDKILQNKGSMTSAQALRQIVDQIPNHLLPDSRKIFVAGLTTVHQAVLPALKALCSDSRALVILPPAPARPTGRNPILELATHLEIEERSATQVSHSKGLRAVIRAKNPYQEVAHALQMAKDQIEQGCPPHQIAIVVANERSYSKIFTTLLSETSFGPLKINNSLPTPFQHTGFGSWVLELGRLLTTKQSWQSLSDIMTHPWRENMIPLKRSHADIRAELSSLKIDLERHGFEGFLEVLTADLLADFQQLQSYLQPLLDLKGSQSPSYWTEFFADFFKTDDLGRLPPMELSSCDVFQNFLQRFGESSYFHNAPVSASHFWQSIARNLHSLEAREAGFSLEGLQILGISEARCIPFHTVIMVGCTEGAFPRSVPNDDLVDDWLKTQIGLEGWEYVEAMEDTTFHLLSTLTDNFVMMHPKSSFQGEGIRSRFVESLCRQPDSVMREAPRLSTPVPDRSFKRDLPDSIGSSQAANHNTMSATRLRSLIQCPYRYLLQTLRVPFQAGRKDLAEGQWLHKVLEHFFTGYGDIAPLGPAATRDELLQRLTMLTMEFGPHQVLSSSLGLHLQYHSWPRWVDHVISRLDHHMSTEELINGVPTTIDGHTWALHGSIDHIQRSENLHIVYDFKRQYQPSAKEVKQGLEPQLPFYALALHDHDLEECVVGYWSILKGSWEARGVGEQARTHAQEMGLASRATTDILEQVKRIQRLWSQRQSEILQHRYQPDIGEWCQRCDYAGLCRRDDPDFSISFEQQKRMASQMEGSL